MPSNPLRVILPTAIASALLFMPIGYAASQMRSQSVARVVMPECQTEDSDNCRWDAAKQGNGKGRSFIVKNGEYHYAG